MAQHHESAQRSGKQLIDSMPAVRETLGSLQTHLHDLDARARQLVQERPLTAVLAAVAIGFVLRRFLPVGRG
jgi:ElaB/YqjD/DUF883 family membrane-anchored ribosome-binding protein